MGCCKMFGKIVEAGFLQPVFCGLLKMLVDWVGTQSFDLLTVVVWMTTFSSQCWSREVSSVAVPMARVVVVFSPLVVIHMPLLCT